MPRVNKTEQQLRQLIREELMREQSLAAAVGSYAYDAYKQYSGEKPAQDLSTAQKVGYGVARGVLGATESGAAGVATGKVSVADEFVTYWDLSPAHKKIIADGLETINSYTSALSIAFPPVAIIPVATGIVSAALKAGDGDLTGAVKDLLGSLLVGLLTGPKIADVLTKRFGTRIAGMIGKDPNKFLRVVVGDGSTLMPELRQALAKLGGATDLQAAVAAGYKGSATARGVGFLLKEAMNTIFGQIDGAIAALLVKIGTKSGRSQLAASYNGLKAQVLALLENPAGNPTITAALSKAEQVAGVSA